MGSKRGKFVGSGGEGKSCFFGHVRCGQVTELTGCVVRGMVMIVIGVL